jgi:DNA polymerase II large subunit
LKKKVDLREFFYDTFRCVRVNTKYQRRYS